MFGQKMPDFVRNIMKYYAKQSFLIMLGTGRKQVDLNLKNRNLIWSESEFDFFILIWSYLILLEADLIWSGRNQIRFSNDLILSDLFEALSDLIWFDLKGRTFLPFSMTNKKSLSLIRFVKLLKRILYQLFVVLKAGVLKNTS